MTETGRRLGCALSLFPGRLSHLKGEGDNCTHLMRSLWGLAWKCCKAFSTVTAQRLSKMLFILIRNTLVGRCGISSKICLCIWPLKRMRSWKPSSAKSGSSRTSQAKLPFLERAVFTRLQNYVCIVPRQEHFQPHSLLPASFISLYTPLPPEPFPNPPVNSEGPVWMVNCNPVHVPIEND